MSISSVPQNILSMTYFQRVDQYYVFTFWKFKLLFKLKIKDAVQYQEK